LCGIIGPETAGWYNQVIDETSDYEGLKIRFAGLGGEVLQELGASVTMLPGGELFQALETGTIDATEFSIPVTDQVLGFNQIMDYNLYPGWHQPFTAQYMLINGDTWDSLSEQQVLWVETACQAATLQGLSEGEWENPKVMSELQEEGITLGQLSDDVLRELKRVSDQVLQEQASQDEDFARVYETQQAYLDEYMVWDRRAYVPLEIYDYDPNE
jgi:TRAP-type mannitol/chloroaromatic compound transport system substrate-binding protein